MKKAVAIAVVSVALTACGSSYFQDQSKSDTPESVKETERKDYEDNLMTLQACTIVAVQQYQGKKLDKELDMCRVYYHADDTRVPAWMYQEAKAE